VTATCVLLADRHHGLSEGVRGLLETAFETVFLVADEASLLEGVMRLQPTMVVADVALAKGDMPRMVRLLREGLPGVKVLLLSVHDEPALAQAGIDAGANGVVLKRAIATDLLTAVEAVLGGKRFISPAVTVER